MKMVDIIRQKLQENLQLELLQVENDSGAHAGHKEASDSGESHFTVVLVGKCFENISQVKRHQMVYGILKEEMRGQIHALSIQALTPGEYARKKL